MLTEIAMLSIVVGAVVGLFEASTRPIGLRAEDLADEAAIRIALAGPDGSAVAAEFRRRGVIPPPTRHGRPWGPPLQLPL